MSDADKQCGVVNQIFSVANKGGDLLQSEA